ncbi:Trichodiene synthase [Paramyrothecium foliicola]|nr:Trichodiene synthase [Paramyrothecium foliicola]
MAPPNFPLESFVEWTVEFFNTIKYKDENFDREERLSHLQYVYAATANHFAQQHQRASIDASPAKMEAVIRTSVQVVVYCWTRVPRDVMASISIYFVYIVLLDDSPKNPFPEMNRFFQDFVSGTPQKHPFWKLMNGHLVNFLSHYGGFCSFAILRSTFDYFQGCWIETNEFQGFEGSTYFPHFLRRLNGLGGICGGSLFPAAQFDEEKLFDQVVTAIAEIEPPVALVNDLISFYKEFDSPRDQISLINNVCKAEGLTVPESFAKIAQDTIQCCQRLNKIFDDQKDPEIVKTMRCFLQGYVTWHLCDPRFRMREVYDRAGVVKGGEAFRRYYEHAMEVGNYEPSLWAKAPRTTPIQLGGKNVFSKNPVAASISLSKAE